MAFSTRRRNAMIGAGAALSIVVIGSAFVLLSSGSSATPTGSLASATLAAVSTPSTSPTPSSQPATASATAAQTDPGVYADLDGMPSTAALAHALPMAIMIDDNALARPQSGFNAASIVYQAPADGGEVRYMAVFQERSSAAIGPVRSGRPYFVRWATEYKPLFGHVGGDYDTLGNVIPQLSSNLYNMDALNAGSCAYHRTSDRVPPFNAYTSSSVLQTCASKLGYPATGSVTNKRPFREDSATAPAPTAVSITVSYAHQTISYAYDKATRSYKRSVDGAAEIDAADGKQVTARNVVVMYQTLSIDPNSEPGYARPVMAQIGSGDALVFSEGVVVQGTWKKTSATDLTRFYDKSGNEIPLVRGRVFIQAIATTMKATYAAN